METLSLRINGVSPLMMNNNQTVNPLNIYTKAIKPLTSKRKKTDDDYERIARAEWEGSLYIWNGEIGHPARCLQACLISGAKLTKNGTRIQRATRIEGLFVNMLNYNDNIISNIPDPHTVDDIPTKELNKLYTPNYYDQRVVKVGMSGGIIRTRPIFPVWAFEFDMLVHENLIDIDQVIECWRDAGKFEGLSECRKQYYGRFDVEVLKN